MQCGERVYIAFIKVACLDSIHCEVHTIQEFYTPADRINRAIL